MSDSSPPLWTPDGPWLEALLGPDAIASVHPRTPRGLARVLGRWRVDDPDQLPQTAPALAYTVTTDAPLSSWIDRVEPGGWVVEIAWPDAGTLAKLGLSRPPMRLESTERRVRMALVAGAWQLQQWPAPDAAEPHLVTLWRKRG